MSLFSTNYLTGTISRNKSFVEAHPPSLSVALYSKSSMGDSTNITSMLSLTQAREKVQYWLQQSRGGNHNAHNEVLSLLQQYPPLAREKFAYQTPTGKSFSPFFLLLVSCRQEEMEDASVSSLSSSQHSRSSNEEEAEEKVVLDRSEILKQVLDLYPQVLQESMPWACHYHQALPLHIYCCGSNLFLDGQTTDKKSTGYFNLDILQWLVEAYPQALVTPDAAGNLPLHYALLYHDEFSCAATKATSHDSHHHVVDMLKVLVDANPSSLLHANHAGETPLMVAIAYSHRYNNGNTYQDYDPSPMQQRDDDFDIVTYMISKLLVLTREDDNHVGIDFYYSSRTRLDLTRCQHLVQALPLFRSLTCDPTEWAWDGLYHLLGSLVKQQEAQQYKRANSKLQKLVLHRVPRAFFTANACIQHCFQDLVIVTRLQQRQQQQNPSTSNNAGSTPVLLHEIQLELQNTWYDKNRSADKDCLELLGDIFGKPRAPFQCFLKLSVSLKSFQMYRQTLQDFLIKTQPSSLVMSSCTIFEDAANNSTVPTTTTTTASLGSLPILSSLQRLEVVLCRMSHSSFDALLQQIQDGMPHLSDLKFVFRETENFGGGIDLTKFVQEMVQTDDSCASACDGDDDDTIMLSPNKNNKLQTLVLDGLYVDPKFLAHYATGSVHNRTYIQYYQYGQVWRQVQYHTALHKFGRGMCHNITARATKESLVECLHALQIFGDGDDNTCISRSSSNGNACSSNASSNSGNATMEVMDVEMKSMVRFGLLLESPDLWCNV